MKAPCKINKIFNLYSRDCFFADPFHSSYKWLAASCLMASRFHLFGVVLARFFFPQFSIVDSKDGAKECIL